MFIKSLIINSFKAFADKTIIDFQEGIAGLIGPNGCGKSNVIDAVKWVFGEQSIKDLRGSNHRDVIFHGADGAKQSNYAEVEVIISNEKNILPIDYNEVSIKRRYYRSGETEYFLNKEKCLLKDVQTLLLNTGIGKNSYSVIEQGKIDKLLSKDFQKRREIFEEAASISKYRKKKEEYTRKIDNSKKNLKRINDILNEKNRTAERFKKQAEESIVYYSIKEKLQKTKIDLALYQLLKLEHSLKKFDFTNTEKEISSIEENISELLKEKSAIKEKVEKEEKEINTLENKKTKVNSDIFYQKRSSEENQKRLKSLQNSIEYEKQKIDRDKLTKENYSKQLLEIKNRETEISKLIKEQTKNNEINIQQEKKLNIEILSLKESQKEYEQKIKNHEEEKRVLEKELKKATEQFVLEVDSLKKKVDEESNDILYQNCLELQKEIIAKIENILLLKEQISKNEIDAIQNLFNQLSSLKKDHHDYQEIFSKFITSKDPFLDLFFSEKGSYYEKEKIDKRLEIIREEIILFNQKKNLVFKEMEEKSTLQKEVLEKINKINFELGKNKQESGFLNQSSIEKNSQINGVISEIERTKKKIVEMQEEISSLKQKERNEIKEISQLEKEKITFEKELKKLLNEIEGKKKKLFQITNQFNKLQSGKDQKVRQKQDAKTENRLVEKDIEVLIKKIQEEYSFDLLKYKKESPNISINFAELKNEERQLNHKVHQIGRINPLAKEEYNDVQKDLEEIVTQKEDIEKSILNLESVIQDIDKSSEEVFLNTLNKVKTNFHNLFRRLFNGGTSDIYLRDEKDVLNSEIEIFAQPPGKKLQNINLASGGEKSLIAISLMFAIFLVKPAPICLLDEVDAALDKTNIEKLANLFNDFKKTTQFLIISHNEATMTIVDYVFGVTMNDGVSKLFSLDLKKK